MDSRLLHLKTLFCLCLVISACSKPKTEETVFHKPSSDCLPSASQNRFIVKWEDGRVTYELGKSRDAFREEFVRTHLEDIKYVEHDQLVQLDLPPATSVTTWNSQYDNWGILNTQADQAWSQGVRGQDVMVAVIDSGLDIYHSQLRDRIAFNDGEMGVDRQGRDRRLNKIDDDGNGFVDDYAGYDFVADSPRIKDYNYHGTHVSGIIAASHNDKLGRAAEYVQGVAPEAKILPLAFINETGGGHLGDAIRAIDYAVLRGAKVINASWGGPICSEALKEKVAELKDHGILFIAAAGNGSPGVNIDQKPKYPASFNMPHQITVGSISPYNGMANHSNYGYHSVTLFAPGVDIYSTVPGSGIEAMSGTSMATPFVSGAVALLMSRWPQATVAEIKQVLQNSVSQDKYYMNATQGRLNIAHALAQMEQLFSSATPR